MCKISLIVESGGVSFEFNAYLELFSPFQKCDQDFNYCTKESRV